MGQSSTLTVARWKKEKAWSDRFIPEIKMILSQILIGVDLEEDECRNTDLIVLSAAGKRIACRVRRHQYLSRYSNEFTIRTWLRSGTATEYAKIKAGWGDLMLYGFANEAETRLVKWTVGNLQAFRKWTETNCPNAVRTNKDGANGFAAFPISIPNFVIMAGYRDPLAGIEELLCRSPNIF